MELWDELVKSALVGTSRDGSPAPAASGALGQTLAKLNGDPEGRLLAASGVLSVYRRAGAAVATADAPAAQPANEEKLPRVPPRSGAHLGLMLGGEHGEVLPEWLAAAAQAGKRAPEEWLPGLLHAGKTQTHLRGLILPVLGQRGLWLAAQNPDWDYVTG